MKKLIALCLIALLTFVGCSQTQEPIEITQKEDIVVENNDNDDISTEDVQEKFELKGLPGSHYTDIVLGLENAVGFESTTPTSNLYTTSKSAKTTDSDFGYEVSYSIDYVTGFTVTSAFFTTYNNFQLPDELFTEYAKNYLGFCSTIPYDNNDADRVREWIKVSVDELTNESESSTKELVVGDAEFSIHCSIINGRIAMFDLMVSSIGFHQSYNNFIN